MLIPEIVQAIRDGRLERYEPRLPWVSTPRVFLMCGRLATQLRHGLAGSTPEGVERWERLEADISFFVEGGLMNMGLLKQLDPKRYEHWTLKSVRPRPSIRVFGRFACPDQFVGTHAVLRPLLGRKWSLEYELEKLACEDHWQEALGGFAAFSGRTYNDYVTENASLNGSFPS